MIWRDSYGAGVGSGCVWGAKGLCVVHFPALMLYKVASAQKIHWGHPRNGYFWN